tara:strand:- start:248 stop:3268 length:3021 start_codon:yes stop_codon:yes gene_type:complete
MSQLFTPYHLYDNLLLWLDGADPNANDGDGVPVQDKPLYQWVDKSQNKYIFEQNTEADAPTYDLANKRLAFDGTEHLSCANIDNWPAYCHVMIVASITYTASTATNVVLSADSADGASDWSFAQEKDSDEIEAKFSFTTGGETKSATSAVTVTNSAPAIFEVIQNFTTTGNYVDVNGANNYAGANTGDAPSYDSDIILNLMKNIAGEETSGTVYEFLVFDRGLSTSERLALGGYLKNKYNLSVEETAAAGTTNVLQAGSDNGGNARAIHPFRNNPPLTGDVVEVNSTGPVTETLPNIYQNAHKLSPRVPMQYVRLSLDFCDNAFGSNTFPSECTADAAAQPCFNTRETCQALQAYRLDSSGKRQYVFSQEMGDRLTGVEKYSHSALISVSSAPTEIVPTKGISLRSNVTIKLRDFMSTDTDTDDYAASRSYITTDQGSYFEKFLARNPHYVGRTVEVFDGYVAYDGSIQAQDGKKKYIIDSMFLDNDVLTIKCKDPMTLADELKAKVPVPSPFNLKSSLAHGTVNGVQLKIDGVDATAAQVHAEYGLSGYVRIEKEILAYTRAETDDHLDFHNNGRESWGSHELLEGETYEADEQVQKCVVFGTEDGSGDPVTINDVGFELLVNQAGIPAEACNNEAGGIYSWVDEKTDWLSSFRIDAILSEPKDINKQLSQLGSMVGVNFFYDDLTAKIIMKAEAPELDISGITLLTDDHIIEDSYKLIQSDKDRVSRVYYYYNIRDHTEDRDKPKNYKNLYVNIDADSEGVLEYGIQSNKVIYGWGVTDTSTATSVSQRVLSRFKKAPITCTFKIDASLDQLHTGDHFYLSTRHITNIYGAQKLQTEMQVLSTKFDSKNQQFLVKAKQFRFGTLNTGRITANNVAAFSTGGGTGTEDVPYTGVRATESYLSDENHITLRVVNGGENFGNGETVTFSGATSTRAITVTYSQSGGSITAVTVTSNAASGAYPSSIHSGYENEEIIGGTGNGNGTGLLIKVIKRARMSGSQEPYEVV